jgi:hypothetical protein
VQPQAGKRVFRNDRQGLAADNVDQPEEVRGECHAKRVVDRGIAALEKVLVVYIDHTEEADRYDKSTDEEAMQEEIAD